MEDIHHLTESNIRWCLGKVFIDFWYDRWLGGVPLASELSVVNLPHMLVAEFYSDTGWNVSKLKQWVPDHLNKSANNIYFRGLLMKWYGFLLLLGAFSLNLPGSAFGKVETPR